MVLKSSRWLLTRYTFFLNCERIYPPNRPCNSTKRKSYPILIMVIFFYMSTNTHLLNKIQRLQNRAIRICLKLPPRSSVVELNLEAKIPFLGDRRKCHLRNFMYRCISLPNYLAQPSRPTRLQEAPVAKTLMPNFNAARKSVFVWGASEWNALGADVCKIQSYTHFKSVQKVWMSSTIFMW